MSVPVAVCGSLFSAWCFFLSIAVFERHGIYTSLFISDFVFRGFCLSRFSGHCFVPRGFRWSLFKNIGSFQSLFFSVVLFGYRCFVRHGFCRYRFLCVGVIACLGFCASQLLTVAIFVVALFASRSFFRGSFFTFAVFGSLICLLRFVYVAIFICPGLRRLFFSVAVLVWPFTRGASIAQYQKWCDFQSSLLDNILCLTRLSGTVFYKKRRKVGNFPYVQNLLLAFFS